MVKCLLKKSEKNSLLEKGKYLIKAHNQNLIEKNWKLLNQKRPDLFNGVLLRVLSFQDKYDEFIVDIVPDVNYKDLVGLRSVEVEISDRELFQVLSCNIFIETADKKTFFVERDAGDWDKALDVVGGFVQEKHNISQVEDFVKRRIFEDLRLESETIEKIEFLGFHDAKEILEFMLIYKVNLNKSLEDLLKIPKVQIFQIPDNYSIDKHMSFFDLPIHPPLKNLLYKNARFWEDKFMLKENRTEEMLEVVDKKGNVIGIESREKIHCEGLLHKEIHVIFVTPKKEIIFQHREKDKASWPDRLDATGGGHVDPGEDFLTAAVREAVEETSIEIKKEELVFGGVVRSSVFEPNTGVTNNVYRNVYGYLFTGDLSDLKIEEGKIIEFVKYDFESLKNLSEEERIKFIPERLEKIYIDIYQEIFSKLNI